MSLLNTYNNENIISRATIAGLLSVLNNDIRYEQSWANDDTENISVPWYYNQSGDERFMQDFYTHYAECNFPRMIDGNFDVIPRGVLTYTGSTIDSNRITNRFVKGRYLKQVDGKLESFVSFMYSIPLTIRFDCELWLDTQITALKVEQAIRETFYKTLTFYMYYKGMRLGATVGFPEDYSITKNIQYSFEQNNKIKLNFSLEVETYQPVFDKSTEMRAKNSIKGFAYNIYQYGEKSYGNIYVTNPSDNISVPKGYPLFIEWNTNNEGAIINKVDIYWAPAGTDVLTPIDVGVVNNEYYIWDVPTDFTAFRNPILIFDDDPNVAVQRMPSVAVMPDVSTGSITADSFSILNPGFFTSPTVDSSVGVSLEMRDSTGKIVYTDLGQVYANISNYVLVGFWTAPGLTYPGPVSYSVIDIHIANTTNHSIEGILQNVKIV